jgi:drug/metabolite transporter (DMT)-like permease
MKLLLAVWPPLFSRGIAGMIASLALAAIARYCGQTLFPPRASIPRLLMAAYTNVFAWMGFSTLCMQWVPVSEGALLVYTMPIWTTLFAWPALGQRPTARSVAALILGAAGIVVLLDGRGSRLSGQELLGDVFAVAAAVSFAMGAVLNSRPWPLQPIALTAWQVGLGCAPMVAIGVVWEHPNIHALSPIPLAVLVYMTIFPMGICYLTWFAALRRLSPAAASTGMLLVPLLGVVFAALLLGEALGSREILAVGLTLGGVTLALQRVPAVEAPKRDQNSLPDCLGALGHGET